LAREERNDKRIRRETFLAAVGERTSIMLKLNNIYKQTHSNLSAVLLLSIFLTFNVIQASSASQAPQIFDFCLSPSSPLFCHMRTLLFWETLESTFYLWSPGWHVADHPELDLLTSRPQRFINSVKVDSTNATHFSECQYEQPILRSGIVGHGGGSSKVDGPLTQIG
jgi:hypothetical protein